MSDMTADRALFLRSHLGGGAFQQFLGLELLDFDAENGAVTLRARWRSEFERGQATGQWHGGVLAALIDVAGDFALMARLGRVIPTVDLRIDYLRPAIDTDLIAKARTLRAGRSIGVVDIELLDPAGRQVAAGRGSYSTLDRELAP